MPAQLMPLCFITSGSMSSGTFVAIAQVFLIGVKPLKSLISKCKQISSELTSNFKWINSIKQFTDSKPSDDDDVRLPLLIFCWGVLVPVMLWCSGRAVAFVALLLSLCSSLDAFYVPGVAPVEFKKGQRIDIKVGCPIGWLISQSTQMQF